MNATFILNISERRIFMNYGYIRISTKYQSIERQERNIRAMCPDPELKLIVEVYTGSTQERPKWRKYYPKFQAGDCVYFDSVSRMARNADEGVKDYQDLYQRAVDLFFYVERGIDTIVYREASQVRLPRTGTEIDIILKAIEEYQMQLAERQIRIAFEQAEKELEDLHQRTKEGLETARLNGKILGRPKGKHYITDKEVEAKRLMLKRAQEFGGDLKDSDCMRVIGISRGTYYRYKKELLCDAAQKN